MRSAERGPTPGSLLSAAMSAVMDSGSIALRLSESRQAQARRYFAHLGVSDVFGLRERLVGRGENHVLDELRVAGIQRLRINLYGRERAVALGGDFDRAATAGGFHGACCELRLHLRHLLLHP